MRKGGRGGERERWCGHLYFVVCHLHYSGVIVRTKSLDLSVGEACISVEVILVASSFGEKQKEMKRSG